MQLRELDRAIPDAIILNRIDRLGLIGVTWTKASLRYLNYYGADTGTFVRFARL
jgi:hypothetical protein